MSGYRSTGRRGASLGLAINCVLAVAKLAAGLFGRSHALIADGIESLLDVFSSAVVLGGLVIASTPADDDHPYGHGKAEPMAALIVSIVLLAAAAGVAYQAVMATGAPREHPAWYTLVVLVVVVAVKELTYRYVADLGTKLRSTALVTDAWHHRSDALTSTVAGLGITVAWVGGPGWEVADDIAALVACSIIAVTGVRVARLAVAELMDRAPQTGFIEELVQQATRVTGAQVVEKILVRKMGPSLFVDMHLEVDPDLTVRQAHGISHNVKDNLMNQWPEIVDVLVHIEPGHRNNLPGTRPG